MIQKPRIERDRYALTMRASRVGPFWAALVGLFLFVAGIVRAAHATTDAGDVFSIAFGLVMFLGALWLGFSEKPLLIVDARGIRAPLCFVPETIGWARVAVVRKAPHWGHSALEIMAWDDARDTTVPAKPVVWVSSLLVPMRLATAIAEIEAYRPHDNTHAGH